MNLTYDPNTSEFVVVIDGKDVKVRDFYCAERQASGIRVGHLQYVVGLPHPTLQTLEHNGNKKRNNSLRAILAGLEGLGYEIVLIKK